MKRLCLSLSLVLSFALIASMAAAFAPVISPLPDIYIGDAEDNVGTIDNNLFKFSNALDLDNYVDDGDTTKDELQWSFVEATTSNFLKINGILQLDLLTEDPRAPGAKDIRAPHGTGTDGLITLRDLKDSPEPDALPYSDPVSPLNEVVTFWVSDGANADSDDVIVQAVDDGTDRISAVPTGVPPIVSYDFEGTNDGWTFFTFGISAYDGSWAVATSAYDSAKIGTTTDNATSRFGFWAAPANITPVTGKLYKFVWQLTTSQATATSVPVFRLRVNEVTTNSYNVEMAITSLTGAMSPPSGSNGTYNTYLMPLNTGAVLPVFDVYDFDSTDLGTVSLDQLDAFEIDPPATGWSALTVPAFTGWTLLNNITPYTAATTTNQTASALGLGFSMAVDRGYAFFVSPGVAWTAGKVNRAVFTISSASGATTVLGAAAVFSSDNNMFLRLKWGPGTTPAGAGTAYPVYFETGSSAQFGLAYEGMDFDTARGGTNTVNSIVLEEHDGF
jgi:hypothetical protein